MDKLGEKLQVEYVAIDSIKEYEKNPRKNEAAVEGVAESIKKFGWTQPLVVSKDGIICAGHTRFKAAKLLNLKEVPVARLPLNRAEFKAYNIADNKLSELAEWDHDLLSEVMRELQIEDEKFLKDLGFDEKEVDRYLNFKEIEGDDNLEDLLIDDEHAGEASSFAVKCSTQDQIDMLRGLFSVKRKSNVISYIEFEKIWEQRGTNEVCK